MGAADAEFREEVADEMLEMVEERLEANRIEEAVCLGLLSEEYEARERIVQALNAVDADTAAALAANPDVVSLILRTSLLPLIADAPMALATAASLRTSPPTASTRFDHATSFHLAPLQLSSCLPFHIASLVVSSGPSTAQSILSAISPSSAPSDLPAYLSHSLAHLPPLGDHTDIVSDLISTALSSLT